MLSAASLSGISNSLISSGYSESVDLDLVDEIIERSPRTATAFPLVYKAYIATLQDNGISPANDTAYYQFLLKLQVIRAGTWGEKWDLWRATHLHPLDYKPLSPKVPKTTRLADVRARVPFLAGASSDLDDAFAEGETSYSADGESVESRSPVRLLRPSPRKAGYARQRRPFQAAFDEEDSRSLVGYTPDQSLDFSPTGLGLRPIRTSTPLFNNKAVVFESTVSATPPPYSASVTENFDLTEEDGLLIQGLSTPKAGVRQLEEERKLEEEVVREMERRADQFYETGLLGRCFDVWAQANDWVQKTTVQIDSVRSNILLRQHLLKWRAEKDRILSLPNTADAHRRTALQSSALSTWIRRHRDIDLARREAALVEDRVKGMEERAWGKWRTELTRRRTRRWEKDMRSREKRFIRARETVLVQDVLDRWRGETRTQIDNRLAIAFDTERLLRHTFGGWHYRLQQKERLEGQLTVFERTKAKRSVRAVWDRWVQETRLQKAEAEWSETAEANLTREVWDIWRSSTSHSLQADAFARRTILVKAMLRWRQSLSDVKALHRKAAIFRQVNDQAIVRSTFTKWVVSEREVLLVRVLHRRTIKTAFEGWRNRISSVRALEDRIISLQQSKDQALLQTSFQKWGKAIATQRSLTKLADEVYEIQSLKTNFGQWRAASAKIRLDIEVAEKARAFFVLRQAYRVWKGQGERRKQERWSEMKRIELIKRIFEGWKGETRRSIEGRQRADTFRQESDQRSLNMALSTWTERVIFLKSRQLDISENRDNRLLSSILSRWIRTHRKIADSQALAESFVIVKGEETLREVLGIWRDKAIRRREVREASIVGERRRREGLLKNAWEVWRDKAVEKRLGGIVEEVSVRHEDAILFGVWDKWKAKATLLPAITFDNHRVKLKAWSSMIRAMDRAKAMKDFGGPRDRRLLEDVIAVWREKTQVKIVARAGRLRGRHRIPSQPHTQPPQSHRIHSLHSPVLPSYDPIPSYHPTRIARIPIQTIQRHVRSSSTSNPRHIRTEPASLPQDELDRMETQSVFSEPAYSRLRSELTRPRLQRGASEEPGDGDEDRGIERGGRSELINALKGAGRR